VTTPSMYPPALIPPPDPTAPAQVVLVRTEDGGLLRLRHNPAGAIVLCDVGSCEQRGRFSETVVRSAEILGGNQLHLSGAGLAVNRYRILVDDHGSLAISRGTGTAAAVEANVRLKAVLAQMFPGRTSLQVANLDAVIA